MHVQRNQVVIGQRFRNRDFQLRMLLLHLANELNKAIGPIYHFGIVLPIGKIDVFTSGFGWFLLVNCKLVEFGYEPFVVIQYAARRHSDLLQLSLNFSTVEPSRDRRTRSSPFRAGVDWGSSSQSMFCTMP